MAQHGRLTRQEKKEIRIKRRALRKDLKRRGIRSKSEFEVIAQQMGLVYGGGKAGAAAGFWRAMEYLRQAGALWLLAAGIGILAVVSLYALLANAKDDFTIALSGNLADKGFVLSETEDFKDPQVRLTAKTLKDMSPETIKNLPKDLDKGAGSHNTETVLAYSFWVKNAGSRTFDYDWHIVLNEVKKNLDSAVWVMLYQEADTNDDKKEHNPDDPEENYDGNDRNTSDRVMTVFAKPLNDGTAEHLSGYSSPLFQNVASKKSQNYSSRYGYGISTTPYKSERVVAGGTEKTFWPGEVHKYTIVLWLEGDDPDCTNKLLGGKASYVFKFNVSGEDNGLFDSLNYTEDELMQELER